eukprot:Nitzschia sp. Nitz4//scaffold1_size375055//178001//179534//NITZ4_000271-RA/size375055-processed-gene-0.359-mRNA-1//1//CDS//3329541030//7354//frame0
MGPQAFDHSSTSNSTLMHLPSEDFYSPGSRTSSQDSNTMEGAGSIPTVCNSSIDSDESDSPLSRKVYSSLASNSVISCSESELARIQELEKKRMALRNQRFRLEQHLSEFCGKYAEASPVTGDLTFVRSFEWRDETTGLRVIYSGHINEHSQPHGANGELKFADGQLYTGDVRGGLRCGQGQNVWADGQHYVGEWKSNSRNGRGTHTWPDGRKVSGEWLDGHLNGKVYFSWPNGATYDGMVQKGKKHGRGIHTWSDGRVYSGSFEKGKENGFGTLAFPDGVKYRGQFNRGKKHGYGIMLWKTRTYDGEWVQDKPHGQGRVVWANGATYTGHFMDGKYHGLGVYVWPSGKKFVGRWEEGVKNGHGLYSWPNGKKYDGEYKDGLKEGYGRMTWPDGQSYAGGFSKNVRSGRGVQTKANGEVIHCGMWENDKPIGESEDIDTPTSIPKAVMVQLGNSSQSQTYQEHDICSPNMIALGDDDQSDFSLQQ